MHIKGLMCTGPLRTPEEQAELLRRIDEECWEPFIKSAAPDARPLPGARRVQHYGYKYDYHRRSVAPTRPIPDYLMEMAAQFPAGEKKEADGTRAAGWNQCIVNEYRPGQGITWHTDARLFGPSIICFTLGDAHPMEFKIGGCTETITPVPGSAYVMCGEARAIAQHRMTPFKGSTRRVSVTFRVVPPQAASA